MLGAGLVGIPRISRPLAADSGAGQGLPLHPPWRAAPMFLFDFMTNDKKKPSALLVIAQKGFQDVELNGTRDGLRDAGFEVILASTDVGECVGKFGAEETASVSLRNVNVQDYDRIGFIGGPGAANLWQNAEAKRIAQETVQSKKPLGAICIAPKILAAAEVLVGKKATVWNDDGDQAGFLALHDVEYTGEPVTVDGLIVTANGPAAAAEFGRTFAMLNA